MSGLVMGLAFELPITEDFGRGEKFVLLAYADNAQQDGRNVFPSIELICKKTGYSERQVQTITRKLATLGYLISDGVGPRGTNKWRIPVVHTQSGGAKIAPPQKLHPIEAEKEAMSKTAPEETAPEETAPEETAPELKVVAVKKEREIDGISFSLQNALTDLGVFKSIWPEVAAKLDNGFDEDDIIALLAWSKKENLQSRKKAAQSFVLRLRDGSKAPADYYQRYADDEFDEEHPLPEPAHVVSADDSVNQLVNGKTVTEIWDILIAQVGRQASAWMRDAVPVGWEKNVIFVKTDKPDILTSRLKSTVDRALIGICNSADVQVEFVTEVM
jgi:hypothetical protein